MFPFPSVPWKKDPAEHITYKCNTATQACNGITNIYIKGWQEKRWDLAYGYIGKTKSGTQNIQTQSKATTTKRKEFFMCEEFHFLCVHTMVAEACTHKNTYLYHRIHARRRGEKKEAMKIERFSKMYKPKIGQFIFWINLKFWYFVGWNDKDLNIITLVERCSRMLVGRYLYIWHY